MHNKIRLRDVAAFGAVIFALKGAQKIGIIPTVTEDKPKTGVQSVSDTTKEVKRAADTIATRPDTLYLQKANIAPRVEKLLESGAERAYKAVSKIK
jgi:hypothetical protein